MTIEDKYQFAISVLRAIVAEHEENIDEEYWSSGTFDYAYKIGVSVGLNQAALDAMQGLDKLGEPHE